MAKNKKITDNLRRTYRREVAYNGTTLVSTQIDLNIPRGYAALIDKVEFGYDNLAATAGDNLWQDFNAGLINDPDDDDSPFAPPSGELFHDHIAFCQFTYYQDLTDNEVTNPVVSFGRQLWEFDVMERDVPVVRPLRWNIDATSANIDHNAEICIEYHLVKISDSDMLNLLDIL